MTSSDEEDNLLTMIWQYFNKIARSQTLPNKNALWSTLAQSSQVPTPDTISTIVTSQASTRAKLYLTGRNATDFVQLTQLKTYPSVARIVQIYSAESIAEFKELEEFKTTNLQDIIAPFTDQSRGNSISYEAMSLRGNLRVISTWFDAKKAKILTDLIRPNDDSQDYVDRVRAVVQHLLARVKNSLMNDQRAASGLKNLKAPLPLEGLRVADITWARFGTTPAIEMNPADRDDLIKKEIEKEKQFGTCCLAGVVDCPNEIISNPVGVVQLVCGISAQNFAEKGQAIPPASCTCSEETDSDDVRVEKQRSCAPTETLPRPSSALEFQQTRTAVEETLSLALSFDEKAVELQNKLSQSRFNNALARNKPADILRTLKLTTYQKDTNQVGHLAHRACLEQYLSTLDDQQRQKRSRLSSEPISLKNLAKADTTLTREALGATVCPVGGDNIIECGDVERANYIHDVISVETGKSVFEDQLPNRTVAAAAAGVAAFAAAASKTVGPYKLQVGDMVLFTDAYVLRQFAKQPPLYNKGLTRRMWNIGVIANDQELILENDASKAPIAVVVKPLFFEGRSLNHNLAVPRVSAVPIIVAFNDADIPDIAESFRRSFSEVDQVYLGPEYLQPQELFSLFTATQLTEKKGDPSTVGLYMADINRTELEQEFRGGEKNDDTKSYASKDSQIYRRTLETVQDWQRKERFQGYKSAPAGQTPDQITSQILGNLYAAFNRSAHPQPHSLAQLVGWSKIQAKNENPERFLKSNWLDTAAENPFPDDPLNVWVKSRGLTLTLAAPIRFTDHIIRVRLGSGFIIPDTRYSFQLKRDNQFIEVEYLTDEGNNIFSGRAAALHRYRPGPLNVIDEIAVVRHVLKPFNISEDGLYIRTRLSTSVYGAVKGFSDYMQAYPDNFQVPSNGSTPALVGDYDETENSILVSNLLYSDKDTLTLKFPNVEEGTFPFRGVDNMLPIDNLGWTVVKAEAADFNLLDSTLEHDLTLYEIVNDQEQRLLVEQVKAESVGDHILLSFRIELTSPLTSGARYVLSKPDGQTFTVRGVTNPNLTFVVLKSSLGWRFTDKIPVHLLDIPKLFAARWITYERDNETGAVDREQLRRVEDYRGGFLLFRDSDNEQVNYYYQKNVTSKLPGKYTVASIAMLAQAGYLLDIPFAAEIVDVLYIMQETKRFTNDFILPFRQESLEIISFDSSVANPVNTAGRIEEFNISDLEQILKPDATYDSTLFNTLVERVSRNYEPSIRVQDKAQSKDFVFEGGYTPPPPGERPTLKRRNIF